MSLTLVKHERVWLNDHPEFSEVWLHEQIADDPSILGLGDLEVKDRERRQQSAGRLDMLLDDEEDNVRYEVEIMLGKTDPSHIIRCIEYWDIERRRYPAYDHVAVLVAEEVTTRFLNVMSLLAGSIPLVAIELHALKVGDHIVLNFVRVLDQRALRKDDPPEGGHPVDRSAWEKKVGAEIMKLCDRVLSIANEEAEPKLELKYLKHHIGICPPGSFFNVAPLWPKKGFLGFRLNLRDSETWLKKLRDRGVLAESKQEGQIVLRIRPAEIADQEEILREVIHQALKEFEES